jgi:hypothetical protein
MKTPHTKKITAFMLAVLFTVTVNAQTQTDSLQKTNSRLNKFAFGFNLNQYQHDYGVGLNITTPYIANFMAFRLMGSLQWLQNTPKGDTVNTWSPYVNIRFGVVTRQLVITDKISIYSEGGVVMLLTNPSFSSKATQFGGYGLFGFEFHPRKNWGQFIELGGVGTGAIADKAIGRPIYSNGFLISTGFRAYF